MRHLFAAKADGMDGNTLPFDLRDGFKTDAAGVVRAIAQQYYRADRQGGRIRQNLLQVVADVRCRRRCI